MSPKKKYTVTIEVDNSQSIQACERLYNSGQLSMLVSLLVDLEIPRYASGDISPPKTSKHSAGSLPPDLVSLLYDIKETAEEIKDKFAEQNKDTQDTKSIKDDLIDALESYGSVKRDDISSMHISAVAVTGDVGQQINGNGVQEVAATGQVTKEEKKLKQAEPTKVGNAGFKNKLAKMKKFKG